MRILITGAAGFIGSHLAEHIHRTTNWHIICLDKLSYASKGWQRLIDANLINSPRVKTITWDLITEFSEGIISEIGEIDIIIHMAAETHVDRSISAPVKCLHNNIMSTVYMLEYARTLKHLKLFQYFSTDEVFGPAPKGVNYKEWDRHKPTNPYSASKAASEDICIAYENTYKIPLIITNLMNVFGERQYVEKFIPLVVKKVLNGDQIDIHTESDKKTPGSRFYIHARNVAAAVLFIINNGKSGEKYNITGEREVDNLELATKIATILDKPLYYNLVDFHENRPGHDTRYSLDGSKLFDMGWKLPLTFDESFKKTILWTANNPEWLQE